MYGYLDTSSAIGADEVHGLHAIEKVHSLTAALA